MSSQLLEISRRRAENAREEVFDSDPLRFFVDVLFQRADLSWKNGEISFELIPQDDRDERAIVVSEGCCLLRMEDGRALAPDDVFHIEDRQQVCDDLQEFARDMVRRNAYGPGVLLMPASLIAVVPASLPAADYAFYATLLIFAIQEVHAFVCKIPDEIQPGESIDPVELVDALVTLFLLKVESGQEKPEDIDEAFSAYAVH